LRLNDFAIYKLITNNKKKNFAKIYAITLFTCTFTFYLQAAFAQQYKTNLEIRSPFLPKPVVIDGRPVVYYELYITNFGLDTIHLKTLQISDSKNHMPLASFDNEELKKKVSRIGTQGKDNSAVLPSGSSCVVYIELDIKKQDDGNLLAHSLKFETSKMGIITSDSVTFMAVNNEKNRPLVLGPPLRSGIWAAVYDPSWRTGHRRVIYTVNGHAYIPGRFAIDFIKLNKMGRLAKCNDDVVKDWYGYGADVLAVADGVVASVRNDFLETPTVSGRERVGPERATGNYISVRIGKDEYAFYEHLKPGSIKVKAGQNIKKGQVIAALGFTGQSDGPHLHFHLASKDSPLGAEGIPYNFEHFTYLGKYNNIYSLGKSPWAAIKRSGNRIRVRERPLPNSVISFFSQQYRTSYLNHLLKTQ